MVFLRNVVNTISGTPQFRIVEDADSAATTYAFYTQADLEDDLRGLISQNDVRKHVRTSDKVVTASSGDVVFSLLSGTAAIARLNHQGYLLTQNYVVLKPLIEIDARYLVYLLNECRQIRHQLYVGQQGSMTMKHTLGQLRDLVMPGLPSGEKQKVIGELYLSQLKLEALRKRASESETALVLGAIRKAEQS